MRRSLRIGLLALTALGLAGCDLAPTYHVPVVMVPDHYKESGAWQPVHPADDQPRGDWWRGFHDDTLDRLEGELANASPTLALAVAAHDRATALAEEAGAELYPQVGMAGALSNNRQSDHRPLRSSNQPSVYGANTVAAGASYELDLWGRVRNLAAEGEAQAQASAADLESVRLSLRTELADAYVRLREDDQQLALLDQTVAAYDKALRLTRTRFDGKISSALDVARAQNQLSAVQSRLADLKGQRALLEHAIAVLVGKSPSVFSLPARADELPLPAIAPTIPSRLLQRRPDVAAAERRMAAANDAIGVARAAYFPSFTLNLLGGFQDTAVNMLTLPDRIWAVGPGVDLPIFDGGKLDGQLAEKKALFVEASQSYRAVALQAFREVEDALASLRSLKQALTQEEVARQAAHKELSLSQTLYVQGVNSYLDVVTSQVAALDADRAVISLKARLRQADIALIRAIGGAAGASLPAV